VYNQYAKIDEQIKLDEEFQAQVLKDCEPESGTDLFDVCGPNEIRNIYCGWIMRKKFDKKE